MGLLCLTVETQSKCQKQIEIIVKLNANIILNRNTH